MQDGVGGRPLSVLQPAGVPRPTVCLRHVSPPELPPSLKAGDSDGWCLGGSGPFPAGTRCGQGLEPGDQGGPWGPLGLVSGQRDWATLPAPVCPVLSSCSSCRGWLLPGRGRGHSPAQLVPHRHSAAGPEVPVPAPRLLRRPGPDQHPGASQVREGGPTARCTWRTVRRLSLWGGEGRGRSRTSALTLGRGDAGAPRERGAVRLLGAPRVSERGSEGQLAASVPKSETWASSSLHLWEQRASCGGRRAPT